MKTAPSDLLTRFSTEIDWDHIIDRDQVMLCALSGGPDSVALCDLLDRMRAEFGFIIHVVHLNHGIRGEDADKDEAFVRDFCIERDIPVSVEKIDVKSIAEGAGVSIEMAARKARYEFFQRAAVNLGTDRIALGHNADDRVENLLLRLLRGSGGRGLGSLRSVNRHGELLIIRPLLGIFKSEIISYLEYRGLNWRTDRTNLEETTDRGRIRNKLLPGFIRLAEESGWSNSLDALERSASHISEDEEYFQDRVMEICHYVQLDDTGGVRFSIRELAGVPDAILARFILDSLQRYRPDLRPEREHIESITGMIRGDGIKSFDIPGGLRVEYSTDWVLVRKPVDIQAAESVEIRLEELPVSIKFGNYRIKIKKEKNEDVRTQTGVEPSHGKVNISIASECSSIQIRTMKPGDRIAPMGMDGHTRKISDIFIDRKIPREKRPSEPLVVSEPEGEILTLPGLNIVAENAKVNIESKLVISISTKAI